MKFTFCMVFLIFYISNVFIEYNILKYKSNYWIYKYVYKYLQKIIDEYNNSSGSKKTKLIEINNLSNTSAKQASTSQTSSTTSNNANITNAVNGFNHFGSTNDQFYPYVIQGANQINQTLIS